jgi:hypothetical protein
VQVPGWVVVPVGVLGLGGVVGMCSLRRRGGPGHRCGHHHDGHMGRGTPLGRSAGVALVAQVIILLGCYSARPAAASK